MLNNSHIIQFPRAILYTVCTVGAADGGAPGGGGGEEGGPHPPQGGPQTNQGQRASTF